jgi:hypothetical protein
MPMFPRIKSDWIHQELGIDPNQLVRSEEAQIETVRNCGGKSSASGWNHKHGSYDDC